ncbi:hypothetical protein D3C77_416810 [compost metagenome]
MGDAAAGSDRQHHLVAQGAFGQQVEQGFQRTGERGLVHRGSNHQAIGLFYQLQEVLHLGAVETCMEQVFGRKIPHLESHHFHALALQPLAAALKQDTGAGTQTGTTTERNNQHWNASLIVF